MNNLQQWPPSVNPGLMYPPQVLYQYTVVFWIKNALKLLYFKPCSPICTKMLLPLALPFYLFGKMKNFYNLDGEKQKCLFLFSTTKENQGSLSIYSQAENR